jgi:hypothetical protein
MQDFLIKRSSKNMLTNFVSTHTRIPDKDLNIFGGNYCINSCESNEFWNLYYNHVFEKGNKEYLTEKQYGYALAIDFDFRYCYDVKTRQHTKENIEDIVFKYSEIIKECYLIEPIPFDIFVFEKPNVNRLEDGSLTKDGIHIIFGLQVDFDMQQEIRNKALKELPNILDLPLINTWDSVLDEGISKGSTNWQLFGSRKPANEAYELTHYYVLTLDKTDNEFMVDVRNVNTFDLKTNFSKLSVQYPNNPKFQINPKMQKPKKTKINKYMKQNDETDTESIDTQVTLNETDIFYKYLNCIGNTMCGKGEHEKTISVLQALKNEGCNKKYVKYWIETFCDTNLKKYNYALDKYDKYIYYTPLSQTKRYSIKSLKKWAKNANPILYGKYFKNDYDFQIRQKFDFTNLINTHQDESVFSKLIYELTLNYIFLKEEVFYLYYNDEWRVCKKGGIVKQLILDIFDIYIKVALDISNAKLKSNLNDEENCKICKKMTITLLDTNLSIKKNNYINNIFSLLKNKLSSVKCEIIFDLNEENHYKIHFKNGVFDLKEKIFRSRNEMDFVTQILNYDYMEETEISEEVKKCTNGFFERLQPNEEQRRFTLSYLAYCLTGNATKQVFKMNIGHSASNGKSTEMAIHEKCFDIYTEKCETKVLQLGFEKRHKFLDSLVTKPIRLLYFEELPKGKKLDVEFLKDFVDGKGLKLEKMFGTKDDVKLQTKIMTASNHDFKCDTDEGIIRRGRVQYYTSKFVDENIDEENHIYLKEEGFENRFNNIEYKNAYFHLLLNHIDILYIPIKNKNDFKEKAEEGDTLLNDILEYFEFTNDTNDKVTRLEVIEISGKDAFNDYKEKFQSKGCTYESREIFSYKDETGKYKQSRGIFTKLKKIE